MPTVLIGPGSLRNQPGPFREILTAAGFRSIDPIGGPVLTESELRAALPEADAIIAGGERLTAEILALAPRLRVIARTGVGYDAVDVAAATARKIPVVDHARDEPGERGRADLRAAAGPDAERREQRPDDPRGRLGPDAGPAAPGQDARPGRPGPDRPGRGDPRPGLRDARRRLRPDRRRATSTPATASAGSASTSCSPPPTWSACTCP